MRRMKNSIILSALQIFAFLFCSMATAAAAVEPANSSAGIPNIFLINLPLVSYYEIGTALTANHGHASMMGVYGMMQSALRSSACAISFRKNTGPKRRLGTASGLSTLAWHGWSSRQCLLRE